VECSGAAAAAYNGVSRTLGPERLLWHGNSDEFRMKKREEAVSVEVPFGSVWFL